MGRPGPEKSNDPNTNLDDNITTWAGIFCKFDSIIHFKCTVISIQSLHCQIILQQMPRLHTLGNKTGSSLSPGVAKGGS